MGNFEVIYSVKAEISQYLEDITVDEINTDLFSIREGGLKPESVSVTALIYQCNCCDTEIEVDMTKLTPQNITQCGHCNEVVCDMCMIGLKMGKLVQRGLGTSPICCECAEPYQSEHICDPNDKYCQEGANPNRPPDHDSHITGCNCELKND